MKAIRFLMVVLLSFLFVQSKGQWINSITMVPSNPTEVDTIYFYVDLSFPSGPCHDKTITTTSTPPNLFAYALHCLGPLTVICDHTDTIVYHQLPPGNYNFTFQVDAGGSPSPCTPGIVPGPTDNVSFTVLPVVSVVETIQENEIIIYPNPAYNYLSIKSKNIEWNSDLFIKIFSVEGKILKQMKLNSGEKIDITTLPAGIYFVKLINDKNIFHHTKLIINK